MKLTTIKGLLMLPMLFLAGSLIAQPPPGINFQAVAKDPLNNPAKNRTVYVKDIIYQTSAVGGTKVWEETHVTTADADGIFLIVLGQGQKAPGILISDIGKIDWANGPFFLNTKIAVAPSIPATWWVAADNYIDAGTTQMQSVPFALFAGNASVTNVNTSITPGPPNTFLITDSLGNVSWTIPQAASQSVTTVTNFNLNLTVIGGQTVSIPPNTTAVVSVNVPGVRKGDPIIVTPQDDYLTWAIYSSWVAGDDTVKVRFANFTSNPVAVLGSQYKIVVIKN
jgi:hypothetical protein